jgi:hypothetical protein
MNATVPAMAPSRVRRAPEGQDGEAKVGELDGPAPADPPPRERTFSGLRVDGRSRGRAACPSASQISMADRRSQGELGRRSGAEAGSVDELHDEEGDAAVLAHVVHGDDVGVVQRGRGTRLAHEALARVGRRGRIRQDLDRDVAVQVEIARAVDDPHPAASELAVEAVASPKHGAWPDQRGRLALPKTCVSRLSSGTKG